MADLVAFLRRNRVLPRTATADDESAAAAAENESAASGDHLPTRTHTHQPTRARTEPTERMRRATRKRRRHATFNVPSLPPVYTPEDQAALCESAVDQLRMASFDDLLREFPHLRTELGAARSG